MKNLLFKPIAFVILILLPLVSINSQCGFETSEELEPVLTDYSATDITVSLVFHIIRRTDQTGGASSADLAFYMTELYNVYEPAGIVFDTLCTNFIDSTPIFNSCRLAFDGINWTNFQIAYSSANAINVFIHPALDTSGYGCAFGNGNLSGYSCFIQNRAHRNLISHEIGHVLNLLHTFETSRGKSCLDDSTSLINGGDLCLDTPPDEDLFDFRGIINLTNCTWDTSACIGAGASCTDGCGNYPHPGFHPGTMMSYYHECTSFFTKDQKNRMKDKIINHSSGSYFDLPVEDLIVDDSLTISSPYRAAANIIIETGGVLIVTSTLYMPEKAKIRIEGGGILSVNGGTITKGNFKDLCGERTGNARFWRGIEMSMTPTGAFPKTFIVNGTVEFSELGIHNDSRSAGNGQIIVNGSTFRNNMRSINVIRASTGFYLPMVVKKTRFYIDNSFPLSNYTTQVKLDYSVISFDSCLFDKPTNKTVPIDTYAIKAFNSGVTIKNSNFKDSLYGLQASSMLSTATIGVTLTKFEKLNVGINTNGGVNDYSVTKDTFLNSIKYGLLSDRCTGYLINNNDFKRTNSHTTSVGILMSNSGTAENVIQKNKFTFLLHGNISSQDNSGLQYLCNENSNKGVSDLFLKGKVFPIQGTKANGTGNTTEAPSNVALKLDSLGLGNITYYYKNVSGQVPQDITNTGKLTRSVADTVICLIKGKPKSDTIKHLTVYEKLKDTMNIRKNTRTDSIDGGNTTGLLAFISGANSGTATSLYNQLINRSPWLSSEVVLAAYNRSDILDSTKRANILFENPDLFASREFIQSLANADVPLPSSSLQALDTLTNYSTIRTDLEAEIATLKLEMNELCYDMLYELKMDTVDQTDSILVWLDRADDYGSRREIAETYFINGDYSSAYDAVDDLSNLDNLTDDQNSDIEGLVELLEFMEAIKDDDRYEGNLSEEEIEWLIEFAESNPNQAGAEAIATLDFYYGIQLDGGIYLKSSKNKTTSKPFESVTEQKLDKLINDILLFPNPSQNEITLGLPMIKEGYWEIELKDINGKVLQTAKSHTSSYTMDISKVSNGVYLVECANSLNHRIVKRIQIIK